MVLAEGANSVTAERHGLVTRPAGEAMALGIKEVLSLETSILKNVHLENNERSVAVPAAGSVMTYPAAHFFILTKRSLGIVCPLFLTQSRVPARSC